ncbi:hypothetical protein KM043_010848 [Ampulex compressa]|nr:hypothetical protein KM043_010848 [Ampulex compressa]
MRSAAYYSRCINNLTTWIKDNTCILTTTTFGLSLALRKTNRLLLSKNYRQTILMQRESEHSGLVWDPLQIFHCQDSYKYAIIILNRPIRWVERCLLSIWKNAQVTITVDGGTTRWMKYLDDCGIDLSNEEYKMYIPNIITGDLDSCPATVIEKLRTFGSMVIETPDQSATDYTKALKELGEYMKKNNINLNGVYVLADSSGRFDHIMANINTLYKSENLLGNVQLIQIAKNSLTWLLKPGFHRILIPDILIKNDEWCGLLPCGRPVRCITTTGLKWNLDNASMEFGGLVSSSNTYGNCSEVTVNTDTPVLWSMGIESLKKSIDNEKAS